MGKDLSGTLSYLPHHRHVEAAPQDLPGDFQWTSRALQPAPEAHRKPTGTTGIVSSALFEQLVFQLTEEETGILKGKVRRATVARSSDPPSEELSPNRGCSRVTGRPDSSHEQLE